ncbi:tripartite tricarboxylate transporter TctB family protein [Roseovarius sp. S4756]|uniref:tripartite tricarboxylate transporter TctB family protein n=1 Tax=Roseovarius maritimus TaxID=3342637 RepID=UPI0037284F7B
MPLFARPINGQAIFAVLLLVLTTVYATQIPKLGLPFENGVEPGASFLPIVLSAIMYLCAGRMMIAEFRREAIEAAPHMPSDHIPRIELTGPLLVVVFTIGFAAGLERVGYFVAAGSYTFAVALYFNCEESGRILHALLLSAATSVALTLFGWLFFEWLFELSLPGWSIGA